MSSSKKKGLGRGLSALFGDQQDKEKSKIVKKDQTSRVNISDLSPNKFQPRAYFNEEKLDELVNSIKKNGIIQPIAVRPDKADPSK